MYAEESGDLRASSVNTETLEILLKAVSYLQLQSTYPVEKVFAKSDFQKDLIALFD